MDILTHSEAALAFRCDKDTLNDKLTIAFRAAPAKATLAALSGVLLRTTTDGQVILSATDGELAIETSLTAEVSAPGETVLHRLFGDIVRSLPSGLVDIVVDNDGLARISTGKSRFSLRTYSRDDFPTLPVVESPFVDLVPGAIVEAIDQTVIAATSDRTRPVLTGVLLSSGEDGIRFVATDSYRLALRDMGINSFLGTNDSALLPAKALVELARLIPPNETDPVVGVGIDDKRIAFRIGDTTITALLIDGSFPSYNQLIPEHFANRLEVGRDVLLDALRRVALLARDSTPVRLSLSDGEIRLLAVDPELSGEADEEIEGDYSGEPMTIAFNPAYLREGIEACSGEHILIETSDPLKPAMIRELDSDSYQYLLMPVRV